ncbi:tRNA pseudouridine(38-40) synthase TruA [Chloroflexota bacterium]
MSSTVDGASDAASAGWRLWARVEYDGTDFYGFQIQARERTVQGELERALHAITGRDTRVVGAGRTDRGVHASGQVVGFEVRWKHGLSEMQRALNAVLAPDVSILELGTATEGFHPRFSARGRSYRYTLLEQDWRSPLARRTAWQMVSGLDTGQMVQASRCLLGTHDFKTFGRPPQGDNTVRTVYRADWQEQQPVLTFDIKANAFLYRMVRSIVGTLVLVGSRQITVQEFETILQTRDRGQVKQVAPAHGLSLTSVDYPEGVLE